MTSPKLWTYQKPQFGDIVRAKCSATGRYIGNGMVLFVSAQDNDVAWDKHDPERPPQERVPLPTMGECSAAAMMYHVGVQHGLRKVGAD